MLHPQVQLCRIFCEQVDFILCAVSVTDYKRPALEAIEVLRPLNRDAFHVVNVHLHVVVPSVSRRPGPICPARVTLLPEFVVPLWRCCFAFDELNL